MSGKIGIHEIPNGIPTDKSISAKDFFEFYSSLRVRVKCCLEENMHISQKTLNEVGTIFSEEVTKVCDKFA